MIVGDSMDRVEQRSVCNGSICHITSTDKFLAIHEVIAKCSVFDTLESRDSFERLVVDREKIESTGIGRGVAIAHGKCETIDTIHIGLGISKEGIPFHSLDGKPVHLLFVIASTPNAQISYLRALASIMGFVKQTNTRSFLEQHTNLDFPETSECDAFFKLMASQEF